MCKVSGEAASNLLLVPSERPSEPDEVPPPTPWWHDLTVTSWLMIAIGVTSLIGALLTDIEFLGTEILWNFAAVFTAIGAANFYRQHKQLRERMLRK